MARVTAKLQLDCPDCGHGVGLPFDKLVANAGCPGCGRIFQTEDGILLLGGSSPGEDYADEFYPLLAEVEPRHFWFRARRRLILAALRASLGTVEGRTVLDVGCGTGFVLEILEDAGMRVCGLDMNLRGLRHARTRCDAPLIQCGAGAVPFRNSFDAVLLCDVIEHVADERVLLERAAGALNDSGRLLVTVPAGPHLWSPIDDVSGHKRRYTRDGLRRVLEGVGLVVTEIRYFNALLLPAQLIRRWFVGTRHKVPERMAVAKDALWLPPWPLAQILDGIALADVALSRLPLPVGASLIAVARRRGIRE